MILTLTLAAALAVPQDAAARTTAPPTATFTATGTFSDGTSRRSVSVTSDRDSDGDGVPDEGMLSFTCDGGAVHDAVFAPRDSSSGLATGKRQHQPMPRMTVSGTALRMTAHYDLKTATRARGTAATGVPVTVASAQGWCPAP